MEGDFWHYGGLTRSVELHTMAANDEPVLWRAYVTPSASDATGHHAKGAPDSVDINLVFSNQNANGILEYTVAFDGGKEKHYKGNVCFTLP